MSSETKNVKCTACERRAQKIRETSIKVLRKVQSLKKWKRK